MSLSAGTKLGPYEIQSPLGAGGMGEVYRARDTRLERTVAIKILPPEVSSDLARKQRFQREAKIVSSLNHPHVCILHDVGSQDGLDFLAWTPPLRQSIRPFLPVAKNARPGDRVYCILSPVGEVEAGPAGEQPARIVTSSATCCKGLTYCPSSPFRSAASSAARAPRSVSTPIRCSPPPAPTSLGRPCGQTAPATPRP